MAAEIGPLKIYIRKHSEAHKNQNIYTHMPPQNP